MSDFRIALANLRRPRLLMQAVGLCLAQGKRPRAPQDALTGLFPDHEQPGRLSTLFAAEARIEAARLAGDAVYSPQGHVAVLAALVFEARRAQPAWMNAAR